MNAYKIKDDIVAAESEEQAIKVWCEHFDLEPHTAGPVEKLNPGTYMVNYEQDDNTFEPGPLSFLMYKGMKPDVLIQGE